MRLINTTTLQFEHIPDSDLSLEKNRFAILSHRWSKDEDEVSYDDMLSPEAGTNKKAFQKIQGFCKLAAEADCSHGWVDTCCIDKANSSELNEAVNMMYSWYKYSKICIVYLDDVSGNDLIKSMWFKRGWTLQEMIAPKVVSFFNQHWESIGTKIQLLKQLNYITNIPEAVLNHDAKASDYSVAQRMSWASKRTTKRVEDRAYSLMGLFDINMPIIYGEGEKSFLRLQQHIVQTTKDESIFAWDMPLNTSSTYLGLYAPSPSAYQCCGDVIRSPGSRGFSETNGELSINTMLLDHSPGTYFASLYCTNKASVYSNDEKLQDNRVIILLAKTANENEYVRVRDPADISTGLVPCSYEAGLEEILIHVPIYPSESPVTIYYGFWLRTIQPPGSAESKTTILSNSPAYESDYICQRSHSDGNTGVVRIKPRYESDTPSWSRICWIKFGFTRDNNPVLWIANDTQSERLQQSFEQAVTSQNSKRPSAEVEEVVKEDLLETHQGLHIAQLYKPSSFYFEGRDAQLAYDWPEGRAVIEVDKEQGLQSFVIHKLNVEISIQLQPLCSPTMINPTPQNSGASNLKPTMIWVVDITETQGKLRDQTLDIPLFDTDARVAYFAAFCCYLCLRSKDDDIHCSEFLCWPFQREKRFKDDQDLDRKDYESDAHTRLPILHQTSDDVQGSLPVLAKIISEKPPKRLLRGKPRE